MLRSRGTWVGIAALGAALVGCGGDDADGGGSGGTGSGGAGTGGATGATGGTTGSGGTAGGTGGMQGGSGGTTGFQDMPVPGTSAYDCSPPDGEVPALQLTEVVSGLDSPLLVTHPPDDDRLFIVEREGTIRIHDGSLLGTPFLDIEDLVLGPGDGLGGYQEERGLLGLAFHPNYAENGLFYVHYSARGSNTDFSDGDTVVAEYQVSSDANVADATSERIVLSATQPATNHNGGTISFGSDGYLYIALGDGGTGGSEAQDTSTLLGSILRIDPTGQSDGDYTVPAGNLSETMAGAAAEIWSYGLRNPYRLNFDGCTGVMYIGDVGQIAVEEVNIENPGDGHHNYGWPIMEGSECYMPSTGCDESGLALPAIDYPHPSDGGASITGGAVYRGSAIPALRGHYFYADHVNGYIRSFVYDAMTETISTPVDRRSDLDPSTSISGITSIQNASDGELYFTTLGGTLYRLEAE